MQNILRNKKLLLVALALVVIVGVAIVAMKRDVVLPTVSEPTTQVNLGDPVDAALEFYDAWHEAKLAAGTEGAPALPIDHPRLSEGVRSYINAALADTSTTNDPVLCQSSVPPRVGVKVSYSLADSAQLLIMPRGLTEPSARMAVVKLAPQDNQWVISEISCAEGESEPAREFSFEREGALLKNVPKPLNSEYWHLVFEENGTKGHTAPLFFNENSTCISLSGVEAVCDPGTFSDAIRARVQGEMTEGGVNVSKLTFLP